MLTRAERIRARRNKKKDYNFKMARKPISISQKIMFWGMLFLVLLTFALLLSAEMLNRLGG